MNMGGWAFMEPRLRALGRPLAYVGRDASASPATGSRQVHLQEQKELVEAAVAGSIPHLVRASTGARLETEQLETVREIQAATYGLANA
jgi:2-oxoglutarate dehydrogenase E1 component